VGLLTSKAQGGRIEDSWKRTIGKREARWEATCGRRKKKIAGELAQARPEKIVYNLNENRLLVQGKGNQPLIGGAELKDRGNFKR